MLPTSVTPESRRHAEPTVNKHITSHTPPRRSESPQLRNSSYLGTRQNGATPAHLADAFGITVGRARTDIKTVRDWLGVNP